MTPFEHAPAGRGRRGNCYVTAEALYHLLGGRSSGWVPHVVRHEGDTHWFLAKRIVSPGVPIVIVLDPTRAQFATPPPYNKARGRGFSTKGPSKRARELMDRMLWQEAPRSSLPRRRDVRSGQRFQFVRGAWRAVSSRSAAPRVAPRSRS